MNCKKSKIREVVFVCFILVCLVSCIGFKSESSGNTDKDEILNVGDLDSSNENEAVKVRGVLKNRLCSENTYLPWLFSEDGRDSIPVFYEPSFKDSLEEKYGKVVIIRALHPKIPNCESLGCECDDHIVIEEFLPTPTENSGHVQPKRNP